MGHDLDKKNDGKYIEKGQRDSHIDRNWDGRLDKGNLDESSGNKQGWITRPITSETPNQPPTQSTGSDEE